MDGRGDHEGSGGVACSEAVRCLLEVDRLYTSRKIDMRPRLSRAC